MLGYEYHPEAEAEYLAEVGYYSRISGELGLRFAKEVEAAIGSLKHNCVIRRNRKRMFEWLTVLSFVGESALENNGCRFAQSVIYLFNSKSGLRM